MIESIIDHNDCGEREEDRIVKQTESSYSTLHTRKLMIKSLYAWIPRK